MITNLQPVTPQPIQEPYIPLRPTRPHPPAEDDSASAAPGRHPAHSPEEGCPLRNRDRQAQKDAMPITTVQHVSKPLTTKHIPDNYQLPREGNHSRRKAPTWKHSTGYRDWKDILPGTTLITPD